jgi:nitrate/TMAO reductase-like tetraheme cytochrome c subunit
MAEMVKNRKLTLREILDEIEADEAFEPETREQAREELKKLEKKDEAR